MGADDLEPVSLTFLFNFVKPFQGRITSTSGGRGHVPTSYHYRYRALDFVGPPQEMARLFRAVLRTPASFREAFYDPAGKYVKNGQVRPGRIGGHQDHVHLAR